jgi:hypothetical protein
MHHAGRRRREGQASLLVYGERVEVCAQCHARSISPPRDFSDDPRSGNGPPVRNAESIELFGDLLRRARLAPAQLRMSVEITAKGHEVRAGLLVEEGSGR